MRRTRIGRWWWVLVMLVVAHPALEAEETAQTAPQPSPQAVAALRLLEAADPYQRELGFLRLEALREPATARLIQHYVHSRDPETRAHSLRALAAIQGPESIPLLTQQLSQDKHPQVRRAALLGMEPFAGAHPELLPIFIKSLRDRNTEVRMAAVDIVSRIDDPRAREAILIRNRRERRKDVRRVLKLAMRRLGY